MKIRIYDIIFIVVLIFAQIGALLAKENLEYLQIFKGLGVLAFLFLCARFLYVLYIFVKK